MNIRSLSVVASCLIAPSAFALTFGQHQEACKNPKNFHNQIAPSKIEITCTDRQKNWRPSGSNKHSLNTSREITIETKSEKYDSTSESGTVPTNSFDLACPEFEEVQENVNVTFVETCDTLLQHQDGPVKYCIDKIDDLKRVNPEGFQAQKTGRTFSLCPPAELPKQCQTPNKQEQTPEQNPGKWRYQNVPYSQNIQRPLYNQFPGSPAAQINPSAGAAQTPPAYRYVR
jgi:hypothetical protein